MKSLGGNGFQKLLVGKLAGAVVLGVACWLCAEEPAIPVVPKTPEQLQALEAQVKQIVAKALPAVVGIRVGAEQGSGVIVSEDGLVMTAGHVCGRANQDAEVLLYDGKALKAKTLGVFRTGDAGLVKISEPGKWPFLERGRSADLKPGDWCVALGHPLGYMKERPPVVRAGRIVQVGEILLQTDCALVAGDSGGPLLNLQGKIIGIHSRIGEHMNMNFHVPVDVFTAHWDRLLRAEEWEVVFPSRDAPEVRSAFRPVVAEVARCVVRIRCDGKEAALGTIIGPDGWIVTKASELRGKITCLLQDGRELEAQKVGLSEAFDLALLKIPAEGLPKIPWSNRADPAVGQWVAAVGPQEEPLAIGVISVPRRPVPPPRGMLGVILEDGPQGPVIREVIPNSPAAQAGLRVKDVITQLNDQPVKNRNQFVELTKQFRPGQRVKLLVLRDGQKLEISVPLAVVEIPGQEKQRRQNRSGTGVSNRRDDFPIVLQHDTALRPVDCGGPLVDLSGRAIGINIARAGRTETYSAPVDALMPVLYEMLAGRLPAPEWAVYRKAEAEFAAREAAARQAAEKALQAKLQQLSQEKAALQEQKSLLEKQKTDLEQQKNILENQKKDLEKQRSELQAQLTQTQSAIHQAETEKQKLQTQLAQQTQKTTELLQKVAELQQRLADREKQLADCRQQLANKDAKLAELEKRLSALEATAAKPPSEKPVEKPAPSASEQPAERGTEQPAEPSPPPTPPSSPPSEKGQQPPPSEKAMPAPAEKAADGAPSQTG
ncbi:MAG: trypsin-like peptidase domain-containing protein [Thermoguttaceae bacterium]|nr:trypsin-like peptidase domain-containing protein [Thermoguttaceae bacterium]MDW8038701.1 trypsin-like peptidase domain-containing protein [Thermoguttaceae bacterium]